MRTIKTLVFIAVASLVITSCKKDKDKEPRTPLLTASAWMIVKFEEKENNGAWENTFPYIPTCSKDDQWIFKTNNSVDLTEGATACLGSTPHEVMESTTWLFLEDETRLKIEDDVFTIEQLATTLVISYSETSAGVTSYVRITMNH
jgi:hypothetical protein